MRGAFPTKVVSVFFERMTDGFPVVKNLDIPGIPKKISPQNGLNQFHQYMAGLPSGNLT